MKKLKKISYILLISSLPVLFQNVLPFKQSHLERVKSGCKNLQNLDLKDAPLQNLDFTGADFRNSLLYNADFSNSNLSLAKLSNCNLKNANLTKANLEFANLDEANLTNAILIKTNLNLTSAKKTKFNNTNCHKAKFKKAILTKANFYGSNLKETNFSFSKLKKTNFKNSMLKKSFLIGIQAQEAIFSNANMKNTALNFATLTNASFENTMLQNSILTNTSFDNVRTKDGYNITGATLRTDLFTIHGHHLLIIVTAASNTERNVSIITNFSSTVDITSLGIDDYFDQAPPEIKNFKKENSPINKPIIYCDKCSICMDPFENLQKIAALPCGHTLCQDCANHSLSYKEECPLCRSKVEGFREISFNKKQAILSQ